MFKNIRHDKELSKLDRILTVICTIYVLAIIGYCIFKYIA